MGTVKEFVREKLQERGRSTVDDAIKDYVKSALSRACKLLPRGQEDSESKLNQEFVAFMFAASPVTDHNKLIEKLANMAMSDDLNQYKEIRKALVDEIEKML